MVRFADIHQHVLWGIDDGPQDAAQMQEQLAQAEQQGVGLIAATCHADPAQAPFPLELYLTRLAEANAYCAKQGWALRLVPGCEIFYADNAADQLRQGRLPCLGRSHNVLVEFALDASLRQMGDAARRFYQAGFRPVLAHAERCDCLLYDRHPDRQVCWLKEECGFAIQVNCQTVWQPQGRRESRFVQQLLKEELVDAVASDAHSAIHRPVLMRQAFARLSQVADPGYISYLLHQPWLLLGEQMPK